MENHSLLLIVKHKNAAGIVELSTNYSWNGSKEHLTVNTSKGIFELDQIEKLKWESKPKSIAGVPLEKIFHQQTIEKNLVERNNIVPTLQNNQIYTQGYFDAIKNFIDRVENKYDAEITTIENIIYNTTSKKGVNVCNVKERKGRPDRTLKRAKARARYRNERWGCK